MLALLAANAYLGIEDANQNHFLWFFAAIGIVVIVLLIFRLAGIVLARKREKKATWNTFRQLARTRGLNDAQTEVLSIVVRQARLKRPPKILGSIQLLDKAIQQAQERIEFSEKQLILVDSIRKKLVTSKVRWTTNSEERRQLERAHCSWNTRIVHIAKEVVDKEMLKIVGDEGEKIKGAIAEINDNSPAEGIGEYKAQIRDISAGGVALLASQAFAGSPGDYVLLFGESQRIPFAMENLCGEIRSIEDDEQRGCLVLHYRFLVLEPELRKEIIQYVYEKMKQKENKKNLESMETKDVKAPPQTIAKPS